MSAGKPPTSQSSTSQSNSRSTSPHNPQSPHSAPNITVTSDEINLLLYRYLQESGFVHTAFAFAHESLVGRVNLGSGSSGGGGGGGGSSSGGRESGLNREGIAALPPGALISLLQKGLQYVGIEESLREDGTDRAAENVSEFTLLSSSTVRALTRRDVPIQLKVPSQIAAMALRKRLEQEEGEGAGGGGAGGGGAGGGGAGGGAKNNKSSSAASTAGTGSKKRKKEQQPPQQQAQAAQSAVPNPVAAEAAAQQQQQQAQARAQVQVQVQALAQQRARIEAQQQQAAQQAARQQQQAIRKAQAAQQQAQAQAAQQQAQAQAQAQQQQLSRQDAAAALAGVAGSTGSAAGAGGSNNSSNTAAAALELMDMAASRLEQGGGNAQSAAGAAAGGGGPVAMDVDTSVPRSNGGAATGAAVPLAEQPVETAQQRQAAMSEAEAEALDLPTRANANEILELNQHTSEVFMCAWNPIHTHLIATGSGDASARIWTMSGPNAAAGLASSTLLQHGSNGTDKKNKDVTTLEWSPNGEMLATGSYDGVARVWRRNGVLLHTLRSHRGPIFSLKWNKTGNFLLSGSYDKSTIVWDVTGDVGFVKQQFHCHDAPALDVDWKDDITFASCSTDKTVHVCQVGTDRPLRSYSGHTDEVNAVKWDPSGTLLASCSDDCSAKVWDVTTPSVEPRHDFKSHKQEIYTIKWSPTGPGSKNPTKNLLLATASFDGSVRLWNVQDGSCYRILSRHRDSVYSVAFSPSGDYLASGSLAGQLYIWNVEEGKHIKSFKGKGDIFEVAWNVEETRVASCFSSNVVEVIDFHK